jgi:hypothetical protein
MFGFLKRRVPDQYRRDVDDCLILLLCGFQPDLSKALQGQVDIDGLVSDLRASNTTALECACHIVRVILSNFVESMSSDERRGALRAVLDNDMDHWFARPWYSLSNVLGQLVEKKGLNPQFNSMVRETLLWRLHGMTDEEAHAAWLRGEVDQISATVSRASQVHD